LTTTESKKYRGARCVKKRFGQPRGVPWETVGTSGKRKEHTASESRRILFGRATDPFQTEKGRSREPRERGLPELSPYKISAAKQTAGQSTGLLGKGERQTNMLEGSLKLIPMNRSEAITREGAESPP